MFFLAAENCQYRFCKNTKNAKKRVFKLSPKFDNFEVAVIERSKNALEGNMDHLWLAKNHASYSPLQVCQAT